MPPSPALPRPLARRLALALPVALALGALGAALIEVARVPTGLAAPDGWRADLLFVPSGDPGGLRTLAASSALAAGRAPLLLISGDGEVEDSAVVLGALARRHGVPEDRLLLETRAKTTWENIVFSRPLIDQAGARSVLLVTSRVHARRVALLAEEQWPGVVVAVLPVEAGDTDPRRRAIEVAKTLRYAWLGRLSWGRALLGGSRPAPGP